MSATTTALDRLDACYSAALDGIAAGLSRPAVLGWLCRTYGRRVSYGDLCSVMDEALDGALSCGIEREDVDPSWLKAA